MRINSIELKTARSLIPALIIRPALRLLALLVICFWPGLLLQAQPLAFPKMEYIDVYEKPGVGRKLSKLIMGTDHLGKVPEKIMIEVLNEAVRLGINTFDTAPIYAESAEYKLANWLKSLNRSDLFVITKGGFPRDYAAGKYYSRLTGSSQQIAANIYEQLKWSQKSLGEIGITIYLMHRDDADYKDYIKVDRPQTTVETILSALSHPFLRHRYLMVGVSNWETHRVDESQRVALENPNLLRPVCNSPYFSLLEMGNISIHSGGVQVRHDEMMNSDFQKGVKIMTYSSLGGFSILSRGWFEAKKTALELKQQNERYWGHVFDAIFHDDNEKRYRRAVEFTNSLNRKHGTAYTVDQIFTAYVLAHPRTDFLVIGPRSVEQLRRTVQALDIAKLLTPEDLEYLYRNH